MDAIPEREAEKIKLKEVESEHRGK